VTGLEGETRRVRPASALRLLAALAVVALWLSGGSASAASAESSVMTWGENSDGQLGNGSFPGPEGCFVAYCSRTPVSVSGLSGVTALAGGSQGLALLSDGTVMAWGRNADGQLGNGSREDSDVPVKVPGLSGVTAIAASYGISMALLSNGTVMDWGENGNGQLGDGTTNEDTTMPVQVSGLSEVTAIATGGSYGLALRSNGTVMAWGTGGDPNNSDVPIQVSGLSEVTAIAADGGHSLALLSNGKVMAWGENEYGELGDGSTENSQAPVRVKGLSDIVDIADGANHNLALLANGTVMAWGLNDWGQLGDGFDSGEGAENGPEICGPLACSTTPVPVSELSDVTAIATGYGQSLALLANGTVMSWGENFEGELGNGSGETGTDAPTLVSGLSGVTAIAGGDDFSMAELHGETGYIAGEVTSAATNEPIEGAKVCATIVNGTGSWRCATTNAGGNYTIAAHGSGSYEVRFWAPSGSAYVMDEYYDGKRSSSEADTVSVASGLTTSGIDAQLANGGRIAGTVVSASTKAPIEGVEVCAPESSSGCVLTDTKGEYAISGLQAGGYGVEFHIASGLYLSQYWKNKRSAVEGQLVPVTTGQTTSGISAELEPVSGAITGTVRDDARNTTIKGIGVCAYEVGKEEEKLFGQCATTDSAGEYTITGLTGKEYIIEFYSPSESRLLYATQYYDEKYSPLNAQVVHVIAGTYTANIDAELEEGGKMAGKVTSAIDRNPIEGIEVCFYARTEELVGCAITNAQGEYGTPLIARGQYKVEFTPPLGSDLNYVKQYFDGTTLWNNAQWVSVAAGATTSEIDAELKEGGRIAGTTTHVGTHTSMESVLVCAFTPDAEVDGCAITASTGDYTIVGLASGEYKVGFDAGNSYPLQYYDDKFSFSEAQAVTVAVGSTAPGIDAAIGRSDRSEAPVNTTPPVVSGTDAVGDVLSCANGLWTGVPTPTFTVQWLQDGSPIAGATTNSYTVQSADEGHSLSCEVTAKNTAGGKSAVSVGVAISGRPPIVTATKTSPTVSSSTTSSNDNNTPIKPNLTGLAAPVTITASTLTVSGSSIQVHVQCGGDSCAGSVELMMRIATKLREGKRTVSRRVTIVLARGSISLAGKGKSAGVVLRLTSAGRQRLAHADRRHPVAGELSLSVPGDKTVVKSVLIT
jgi:alpha-tubulin suppressor-like RCC1 family protein